MTSTAASKPFIIASDYQMTGDQPQAVVELVGGLEKGCKHQTLLGGPGGP